MATSKADTSGQYLPGPLSLKPWREIAIISASFVELSWVSLWYRVLIVAGKDVPYLQAFLAFSCWSLSTSRSECAGFCTAGRH
mgnify:CR=1 FL=1